MNCELIYLVQTDTTVGFSSSNDEKLANVKKREVTKKTLQTVNSFKTLKQNTRVPNKYKKMVRNSKKTTFIYPNGNSFRVISKQNKFYDFINRFKIMYSTSANLTTKNFDKEFALNTADIVVEDSNGFFETKGSNIYRLSKKNIKRVR